MTAIKNEIILASAGSGKTYRLTNRFIALMALGFKPERIIALTFTRKAAGEFFDAILEKLADSATDSETAARIAAEIDNPEYTAATALGLLRDFIDAMPRLALGTLDSFLADIVRSFPFEFGLGGGVEILDEHGAQVERERVFRRVFDSASTGAGAFLESFKLATYGREDAGIMGNLERFIDELHVTLQAAPDAARWGNPAKLWPGGLPWHRMNDQALNQVILSLEEGFNSAGLRAKVIDRWQNFFGWIFTHEAGAPIPKNQKTLVKNLLAAAPQLEIGEGTINVDRVPHSPDPAECDFLYQIVGHLVAGEIETRLRRTRGLWSVLDSYERSYDALVRRRGKLSFADLALLLAGPGSPGGGFASDGSRREQIEYRLDAKYDHWLLDEFQDTSAMQWRAIENLVDEAVQDPEGRRSLFQVGDLKQAIYAWRGGDATLFSDLREKYRALGADRFYEEPLDRSYRSSPAVITLVNRVFGDGEALAGMFPAMVGRWEFADHSTVHAGRAGYSAWIAAEPVDVPWRPREEDKLPARLEIAAQLIREIDPLRRGLSVAVLVHRNQAGRAATDYLRAATGLPITNAADIGIAGDNPLTVALRSLFRAAAHPGDGFAWGHLRMTPLAPLVEGDAAAHCDAVLRSIWRRGFEATVRDWLARLPVELDAFSAERADEFARAAARFDLFGNRSIDDFLRFIEGYTVSDAASGASVQVMTVHKSKGLGFDMVILPDLGGSALDAPRREIGVKLDAGRDIEWVLQLPNREIVNADPTLREFVGERSADACYESLCLYYVALTRAKYANYLITDARDKSTSKNFIKLLEKTLRPEAEKRSGTVWESGDEEWYENLP